MGNLIKDFWTYSYKEKNYYGIIEVIKGEDIAQQRTHKKYETHIQKALKYTMKNKVMSHMSIQTYCKWLRDRKIREDNEQKYYPFVIEFEPKNRSKYEDGVHEAAIYVNYLTQKMDINKDDILIMINNSKSIYVFVNPKAFSVKPEEKLNAIYYEMYLSIKKELGLKYVDESIVTSSYKLMKTPNSFYKGGYFVWITIQELMELLVGAKTKEELTKERRSLNKVIPGQISLRASRLYNAASKKIKYGIVEKKEEDTFNGYGGACVKYLLQHMIEEGYRNYGLVSVGIYLKSMGYSEEEVTTNLIELAESWNYDEGKKAIESKVKTIFRRDYKFSCKYAQAVFSDLGIENICDKCKYKCKKSIVKNPISIDAKIINQLWNNNASTRHYILYLDLVKKSLLNKEFNTSDNGVNERTLRELVRLCGLERIKVGSNVIIKYIPSKTIYRLPESFVEKSTGLLGDSLKHYLRLVTKGYRAFEKYIIVRANKNTIMDTLGYTDSSSVYKLIEKLTSIGLLKVHTKTSTITLYYESYKVIDVEFNEDRIIEKAIVEDIQEKSVIGTQITLKEIYGWIDSLYRNISIKNINIEKIPRGSPPKT